MPTPTIDLKPFRNLITTWFQDDLSSHDIAKRLAEGHQVVCTGRTIERRLKEWNVTKRACVVETMALRLKITSMFYMNFPDDMIVRALNEEGCLIGKRAVVRIQKAQGCQRRLTVWEQAEANLKLWEIVKKELDNGNIEGYGKELLYRYFCTKGINTTRY
jgi:hypothetical protein